MRCVMYWFLLMCFIQGGAAIYNLALGRSGILTDGDNSTYQKYKVSTLRFTINLGRNSHIKSTRITFKDSFPAGRTSIEYYDDSIDEWPYYVYKTHATELPQTVEFDDQRTGTTLHFYIWDNIRSSIEFELCEIEIYGCEFNHFGRDCQPCTKGDNCVYCDVNDGDCYFCRHGYAGPNCSISTENVALKKYSYLYQYHLDYIYWPSYLMIDGDTTSNNCLDFSPFLNATIFRIRLALLTTYNIKYLQFHFVYEGDADIWFNYTIYGGYSSYFVHSGIAKISANSSIVIIPFPQQNDYVNFKMYFVADGGKETNNAFLSLCELEVKGCPQNQFGSPCRPCPSDCGRCNAVDGSCICQSGYKGDNCAEKCSNNTYGIACVYSCGHCLNRTCDHVTGDCLFGCNEGWTTRRCNEACSSGWYGRNCVMRCSSHCMTPHMCDRVTGSCFGGCSVEWTNKTCDSVDSVRCNDWVPSNVSVFYHNVTWREQGERPVIRFDPAVNLVCNFTLKPDEDLLYDVIWFIDGLEVFNHTVDSSTNYIALITAFDFLQVEKKIGSNVHCKVGAKREREKVPCSYKVGNPFFAGIKILNANIELERKGSSNVGAGNDDTICLRIYLLQ